MGCLVAIVCAGGSIVRADDVWAATPGRRPLKYSSVQIRGDQNGVLAFRPKRGKLIHKPMEQVVRVRVEGQADLNQAEELFADGDCASAVELYESVAKQAQQTWLKRLATGRLIGCYEADDRFGDAVRCWVATLKVWPSYALSHQPTRSGEKGSQANKQALESLAEVEKTELAPAAAKVVKKMQTTIWKVEGDPRGAAAPAEAEQSPESYTEAPPAKAEAPRKPTGSVDVIYVLGQATRLAEAGHHDRALTEINRAIAGCPERKRDAYLPRLLALKAQCLLAKGDALAKGNKAEQARRQHVYAGLAAMQVITFFPESPSFIDCLYLTGQCHERIGRTKLAASLYQECKEFAIGRKRPKLERLSAQALERLDVKTK
jgi:tetratricopeptide (TPR) repeat protein